MNSADQLRNLPAVDEILRHEELTSVISLFPRQQVVEWIRQSVDDCRQAILSGELVSATTSFVIAATHRRAKAEDGSRQQPVINATGILLHTNLGRSPLAARAIRRMEASAAFTNVEMNLQSGKRNQRAERVCRLLARLTGAEDAVIVNNCAAATMLALQTMASGRDVIVSRGQLVEIGGGFRLPEVFTAAGATLKEVGTTNRTYLRDYEAAVSENTGAIIRVHRSNFYQGGFVTEPDISDLVALGQERNVPVIDDIGSGCIQDLTEFGLQEPTVAQSVAAGADVTLFSGDKLFGGPQAGIIVGRTDWVERCRRHPMIRALRIDKVTLAAVEATAEIHLAGTAATELPLLQMLSKDVHDIRRSCEDVLERVQLPSGPTTIEVHECVSQVGGGSVPGSQIQSFGLRIIGGDIETIAANLRSGTPAILGRIQDESVVLDFRTVSAPQLSQIAEGVTAAVIGASGNEK